MAIVRDLLNRKGTAVWYIDAHKSIIEALRLMADKKIGALPVIEGGKVIGIFSERDFARQVIEIENLSLDGPVQESMTAPVFYVKPDQSVEECMAIMTEKRFRHLPVMENDQLVGIISIGDVVKQLISEKEETIESLEEYIWVNMI